MYRLVVADLMRRGAGTEETCSALGDLGKQVEEMRERRREMSDSDPKVILSETVEGSGTTRSESGRPGKRKSKTVKPRKPSQWELREYGDELKLAKQRPSNSTVCVESGAMDEPCPWVACRYHLYLDVNDTGNIKFNFPWLEPWEMERPCALSYLDESGLTLETVGRAMNLTRERVRQVETVILEKVKGMGVFKPEDAEDLGREDPDVALPGMGALEGASTQVRKAYKEKVPPSPFGPLANRGSRAHQESIAKAMERLLKHSDTKKEDDMQVEVLDAVVETTTPQAQQELQEALDRSSEADRKLVVDSTGRILKVTGVEEEEKEPEREPTIDSWLEDLGKLDKDAVLSRLEDLPAWLRRACYKHWKEGVEW